MTTLGVIADTHVPDRRPDLDPQILPIFLQAKVQTILHAGDVSSQKVLDQLSQIAPVLAVRGNRDWFQLRSLPDTRFLNYDNIPVVLTHGHGGWAKYIREKFEFTFRGYDKERYKNKLLAEFPQAKVIIFGHTHYALNVWVGETLIFNPGSPHFPGSRNETPSLGLLHIEAGGKVTGEIINLRN
jgi:putative phosphoesterase